MAVSKTDRAYIFERDGHACLKCGFNDVLTIDHIIPISKGGSDHRANLQTLCDYCNFEKGATEVDYREWPEYKPDHNFD